MGLFSWFKANDFASMDEIEQMDLADELGITDIKNDVQSIKKQLTDLENSSNWQDNIITAQEAAGRLRQIENEALPKELNKAFAAIDEALNNEQDSLLLLEYTKERNGYTAFDFPRYEMVRVYHIENLAEALRKYGYKVDIYDPEDDYGLRLKICLRGEGNKLMSFKIDPDKKYILPMEEYDGGYLEGSGYTFYAFKPEDAGWRSIAHRDNKHAIRDHYAVWGKDILNAPDWVKAIKPIEVEE